MYVVNTTTVASVAYNLVLKTLNLKDSTFSRWESFDSEFCTSATFSSTGTLQDEEFIVTHRFNRTVFTRLVTFEAYRKPEGYICASRS